MDRASPKTLVAVVQSKPRWGWLLRNITAQRAWGKSRSPNYIYCKDMMDDACHTPCSGWERRRYHLSVEGCFAPSDTWRKVARYTQGILKAKKRKMDKRDGRIAKAPWMHGVFLLFWISLAWSSVSNSSGLESQAIQDFFLSVVYLRQESRIWCVNAVHFPTNYRGIKWF